MQVINSKIKIKTLLEVNHRVSNRMEKNRMSQLDILQINLTKPEQKDYSNYFHVVTKFQKSKIKKRSQKLKEK